MKKRIKSSSAHCWTLGVCCVCLRPMLTEKTLPRSNQSRGEQHASSSTGLGTPRVSTTCWRRWAGLRWSNDARLVDRWRSTKSRVALHIAPPWKANWSPSHQVNDAPMTNSSLCWPPEPIINERKRSNIGICQLCVNQLISSQAVVDHLTHSCVRNSKRFIKVSSPFKRRI